MAELVVDHAAIRAAGNGIRSAAQAVPEVRWSGSYDPGSQEVAAVIEHASALVRRQVLGAAAEMFRIGQRAVEATDTYAAVDRAL